MQGRTFLLLYLGYVLFCMVRKSVSYVIPALLEEGFESKVIGGTLSSLALGYCIGRVLSGALVDKFKPSLLFGVGLIFCGSLTICLASVPVQYHNIIWFLHGLAQGQGWASCGKIVKRYALNHI